MQDSILALLLWMGSLPSPHPELGGWAAALRRHRGALQSHTPRGRLLSSVLT